MQLGLICCLPLLCPVLFQPEFFFVDTSAGVDHRRCWHVLQMNVMTSGGHGVGAQLWFFEKVVLYYCVFAGQFRYCCLMLQGWLGDACQDC